MIFGVESVAPAKTGMVVHNGEPVPLSFQSGGGVRSNQVHMNLVEWCLRSRTDERMRFRLRLCLNARDAIVMEWGGSSGEGKRKASDGLSLDELSEVLLANVAQAMMEENSRM